MGNDRRHNSSGYNIALGHDVYYMSRLIVRKQIPEK